MCKVVDVSSRLRVKNSPLWLPISQSLLMGLSPFSEPGDWYFCEEFLTEKEEKRRKQGTGPKAGCLEHMRESYLYTDVWEMTKACGISWHGNSLKIWASDLKSQDRIRALFCYHLKGALAVVSAPAKGMIILRDPKGWAGAWVVSNSWVLSTTTPVLPFRKRDSLLLSFKKQFLDIKIK